MISTEQTALKTRSRGWNVSMALPSRDQAIQYRKILKDLGYESKPPEETVNGFVVKWRLKERRPDNGADSRTATNH